MLILSISIACYNKIELTKECVEHLLKVCDLEDTEFIFIDNASTDGTLDYLQKLELPHKKIISNSENLGFGMAHNQAIEQASGYYFAVLNNDFFIKEPFMGKMIKELSRPKIQLVGVFGNPCTLKMDGSGYCGERFDYVEGSFFVGRTHFLRKFGLFHPDYKMFCFEDSDLSLRIKQAGYGLARMSLTHFHKKHATQDIIQNRFKQDTVRRNQMVFLSRWRNYLETGNLFNSVLIQMPSVGIGDIVLMTPILAALQNGHPTIKIDVETRFPEVFKHNPRLRRAYRLGEARQANYDRVIDLNPDYSKDEPLYKTCADMLFTDIPRYPEIYLYADELQYSFDLFKNIQKPICVVSFFSSRVTWHGRNWKQEEAELFCKRLQKDYFVVSIGKDIPKLENVDLCLVDKTSLRQLFAVIAIADLFCGTDSLPLHVAQGFQIPSVGLFGATSPRGYIVDFNNATPIINPDVGCVGCYQVKRKNHTNKCTINEICMNTLKADYVIKKFNDFEAKNVSRIYATKADRMGVDTEGTDGGPRDSQMVAYN